MQWVFYVNGRYVYATAYGAPTAMLNIGTNSTYQQMSATDQQIVDFLVSQGVTVQNRDLIAVRVRVKNCQRETAISNALTFSAPAPSTSDCTCSFVTGFATGQTGNAATPPGGYTVTGGELVHRNGLLNSQARDFSAEPLDSGDELGFVTLDGMCADALTIATTSGHTGVTVPVPSALNALGADILVTRNGAYELFNAVSFGTMFVNPDRGPAAPDDVFTFIGLGGGDCRLTYVMVGTNLTGNMAMLPTGYTASNAGKWLLIRGGALAYPAASSTDGYTVAGDMLTFETPLEGEDLWLAVIT